MLCLLDGLTSSSPGEVFLDPMSLHQRSAVRCLVRDSIAGEVGTFGRRWN